MNIEQFIERVIPFCETLLKEYSNDNTKILKSYIDSFKKFIFSNRQEITFSELIEFYESIRKWIESDEVEQILIPLPFQNIKEEFEKSLSDIPDKIELHYILNEELPEIHGIKIITKLQKIFYNYNYKRYSKQILKNKKKQIGRKLNLKDFLRFYILVPIINQIYNDHNHFLHLVAQLKNQMHELSENFKNEILLVQNIETNEQYWSKMDEQDITSMYNIFLADFSKFDTLFLEYKENAEKALKINIENLQNNISNIWKIAGSPLLPKRKFLSANTDKTLHAIEIRQEKDSKKWYNHFQGDKEEWLKDIELSHLQFLAVQFHSETQNIIEKKNQKSILPIFKDIKNEISKTLEIFKKESDTTKETLRSTILLENRNLIKILRQNKLPALTDAIIKANYSQAFTGFFQRIQAAKDNLSDEHTVFAKKDIINIPPQSETFDIPLKKLVEDEILRQAFESREEFVDKIDKNLKELLLKITNLDQIVEFNLEAAYDMLKEDSQTNILEHAHKIATDGLDRTQSNIDEIKSDFLQIIQESNKHFNEITHKLETDIQKICDNEKNLDLKIRLARAKTREKLSYTRRVIWKKIVLFFPEILRLLKNIFSRIQKEYFKIRKVTGLGSQITYSEAALTQFLIETQRKIKKMPYIYQRLFRLEPLEEKRFFHGRKVEMEYIKEDFINFKEGNQAATAIVAEKGNGKTTILKFAEKEYFAGYPISQIDLTTTMYKENELLNILCKAFNIENANSISDIEKKILDENKKQICIIENLQNLFLRVINGFDSLEKLLLLISKTRQQVFWVVSCGLYAWEYLDKVIQISDYFKRIILLEALTAEEIKEVILNRHQVSGYGLLFTASEKTKKIRSFKKISSIDLQQEYQKNLLFEELAEISGGNIKSAILFWLSVLQNFDEEKITVGDHFSLDHSHIYQLQSSDLFTLAAFVEHEYLTEEQNALIFNQDLNESELIINRLYKRGYLEKLGEKYTVYPLLYRPVIKALKSKNILL